MWQLLSAHLSFTHTSALSICRFYPPFTRCHICRSAHLLITHSQRAVMPRSFEGNRGFGIALAMHHGLSGLSSPPTGFVATKREMNTPLMPQRGMAQFTFYILLFVCWFLLLSWTVKYLDLLGHKRWQSFTE